MPTTIPTVLVIGGGQSGLSIAARLKQLNVDTLIVDREKRIGDNWRKRYHALTLHNQVQVNHLPYLHFPPNWPTYIPKDKLANWFEAYVEAMELNFWTETEFEGGSYDEKEGRWTVTLRRADGSKRTMHPRHVVLATGVSGIPSVPEIAGLKDFAGKVMHSSQYDDGENWKGKRAIVIGTGNSGHDIAQDLHSSGANVTLFQRSSTLVVSIEPSAQLVYAPYNEGTLEDNDLIATSMPLKLARKSHAIDGGEIQGARPGIARRPGARRLQARFRRRQYRLAVQISHPRRRLLFQRRLLRPDRQGRYRAQAVRRSRHVHGRRRRMKSGETIAADLVVLATGYKRQEELVRKLFGEAVEKRVGTIWGFGDEQELRNMYTRTGQPGLWLIAGGLAQCRIGSKHLALQIKAIEEGLLPR